MGAEWMKANTSPRTKLSKALITDASKVEWRSPSVLANDFKVDLRTSTVSSLPCLLYLSPAIPSIPALNNRTAEPSRQKTVTKVDPSAQTVTTESGDSIKYDYLVLAPGGMPRRLPIEGASLDGVLTLRGVQDAQKIVDGGFTASEFAELRPWTFS
jgi:NADPH-dependent 2,4-dienoyl-CoA reductase/sulfur reductase-like enzyme